MYVRRFKILSNDEEVSLNKVSYTIEGNIADLTAPTIYFVTSHEDKVSIDTIFSKEGSFTFSSSSDSIRPVVLYLEDGSVWVTVWAQNGETIKLSGSVGYRVYKVSDQRLISPGYRFASNGMKSCCKLRTSCSVAGVLHTISCPVLMAHGNMAIIKASERSWHKYCPHSLSTSIYILYVLLYVCICICVCAYMYI